MIKLITLILKLVYIFNIYSTFLCTFSVNLPKKTIEKNQKHFLSKLLGTYIIFLTYKYLDHMAPVLNFIFFFK